MEAIANADWLKVEKAQTQVESTPSMPLKMVNSFARENPAQSVDREFSSRFMKTASHVADVDLRYPLPPVNDFENSSFLEFRPFA